MSNPEPPREASSAVNNDTLVTINLSSETATPVIATPVTATNPPEPQNANEEINSSIGSQRSLNSRMFPFRFSRDILLNNVSSQRLVIDMTHSFVFLGFSRNSSTRSKHEHCKRSVCIMDAQLNQYCAKQ